MECSKCGKEIPEGQAFCGSCGDKVVNEIIRCQKCGKEVPKGQAYCGNCGTKIRVKASKSALKELFKLTFIFTVLIIFFLFRNSIFRKSNEMQDQVGASNLNESSKTQNQVEVQNFIGMTVSEAEAKANEVGLKISTYGNNNSPEDVIAYQDDKENSMVPEGNTIWVKIEKYLQEEEARLQQAEQQRQEENKIENAIKGFAELVRIDNNGKIIYDSYTKYKVSSQGIQVYKVKYNTSYEHQYYYQLVSLDENNEKVMKSTKAYSFDNFGGEEIGPTLELEYSYEETWETEKLLNNYTDYNLKY